MDLKRLEHSQSIEVKLGTAIALAKMALLDYAGDLAVAAEQIRAAEGWLTCPCEPHVQRWLDSITGRPNTPFVTALAVDEYPWKGSRNFSVGIERLATITGDVIAEAVLAAALR